MPTPELGGGQMICTCSPPVPPKCICTEGNVRNIITGPSLPGLFKPYNCVSTCESSCLDSCNKLNFNMKCGQVCNEACEFTCAKQGTTPAPTTTQAPATTVMIPLPSHIQEYRFVIPAGSLQTKPTTTTTPAPVILSQKIQITCPMECQPACSFVCTKLRPTLKVITQMFDSKTDETTCRTSCSSACLSVCASSGVPGTECQSNCAPACEDTCTIVKPVAVATTQIQPTSSTGGQCVSVCMPACTQQCMFTVQMQIALSQVTNPPQTTEKPAQAVLIPIGAVPIIVPDTTTTTPAPAVITLGTICRNECLPHNSAANFFYTVQCEHQCLPNNPNCMAACQTTCYPVCQSKMRRRMKETKTERIGEDFAHRQ
ncbi:hypothetical protein L5515_014472 [Caenorhabditis briggsae]|uniref:Uncharacterized protein n=1 Tax=Caenorhabditis briggsae TaxID=6238 RepID=A0AAE9EBH5_CAEBR|nr:hypothetical protein L5515_014472 [Caenorhabditis briggsae]